MRESFTTRVWTVEKCAAELESLQLDRARCVARIPSTHASTDALISRSPGDLPSVRQVERRVRDAEQRGVAVPALVVTRAGRADESLHRHGRVAGLRILRGAGDVRHRLESHDRARGAAQAVAERGARA